MKRIDWSADDAWNERRYSTGIALESGSLVPLLPIETSFEETSVGSLPSGWSEAIHGSNGGCNVDDTRASDGSQSMRNHDPNTGGPSHSHCQTDQYTVTNDHTITFDYYIDGNKNNSGSADTFNFGNYNQQFAGGDSNHDQTYTFSWRVDPIQGGSNIDVYDGNGDGSGSLITLESSKFDQWVTLSIDVEYSNNQFYVSVDGTNYGPFGFWNNGSGSDFPVFHNQVDNWTGWFDNIRVN